MQAIRSSSLTLGLMRTLPRALHALCYRVVACAGQVRGLGLMIGLEFAPEAAKQYKLSSTFAAAVSKASFDRGMLLLTSGRSGRSGTWEALQMS